MGMTWRIQSANMSKRSRRTHRRRQERRGTFRSLINKWTLGGAALVLIGLLGFLVAVSRPSPGTTPAPGVASQPDIPYPEVPRAPLAEVKAKSDAGTALIVDTRSPEEYAQQHIPGAISLPLSDLSTQNPDLPRDAEIITYCT